MSKAKSMYRPGWGLLALAGGIVVVGMIPLLAGGKPAGPPPPPSDADAQRGYQVLPSCKINVIGDESLAYKWAASLGQDPSMSIPQAISKAIDNCTPEAAVMAAIKSPEDIRTLYFFLHALRSAAVTAGKQTKEQFNAEITQALAMLKMYGGPKLDTTGWPGPLP